jgi:hypothetical protein
MLENVSLPGILGCRNPMEIFLPFGPSIFAQRQCMTMGSPGVQCWPTILRSIWKQVIGAEENVIFRDSSHQQTTISLRVTSHARAGTNILAKHSRDSICSIFWFRQGKSRSILITPSNETSVTGPASKHQRGSPYNNYPPN